MAINATIVTAWQDGTYAYLAVSIAEGPPLGKVEYIGSTPLIDDQGNTKTLAALKADLVAACKAQRDSQIRPAASTIGIAGTVTM